MNNIFIPLLASFIAGLGTVLGSLLVFISKLNKKAYIGLFLVFSGIIMIYITLTDLLPSSIKYIISNYSLNKSIIYIIIPFIIGYILVLVLNKYIEGEGSLKKISILSFIALIIHNFPEGIATMITMFINRRVGIKLTTSILVHNIPEGIILAFPITQITHSPIKGVGVSLLAGLSEPIGALICFLFLKNYFNKLFLSLLLIFVSGLMISLSINNIFTYLKNSNLKYILYGIILSIIYILISILI